jgi:hypothetical protein
MIYHHDAPARSKHTQSTRKDSWHKPPPAISDGWPNSDGSIPRRLLRGHFTTNSPWFCAPHTEKMNGLKNEVQLKMGAWFGFGVLRIKAD